MLGMKMNAGVGLVLALCMTLGVQGHIALWDEAMYGWDAADVNQYEPVLPLQELPFNQWWFHNYVDRPPAPGKIMNLPAGGTYHGQVACNKAWTKYGVDPKMTSSEYACDDDKPGSGTGAMHTTDRMGTPNPKDVKGCGLSIAYESDVHKLKPEDFTVISIAYDCPWKKNVDFHIPADLPPCPEGGCHCTWGWVHSKDGGSAQMYQLGYRCDVTGATLSRALPKPAVSRKCDYPNDVSNCTVGAKQPHYWFQTEGNNNFQGQYDPPFYNHEMGFMNGAQTDLFAGLPAEVAPAPSTSPSPSSANLVAPVASSASTTEVASDSSSSTEPPASTQKSSFSRPAPSSASAASSSNPSTTSPSAPSSISESSLSPDIPTSTAASAISAVINTAASAPSPSTSASKAGRCKRKRRRSMDVQRHQARSRNRTMGVRHTTALAA